jgi:hypothetical protein
LPALVRVAAAVLLLVGAGFGLMSLLSDHPSTPLHEFTVEKTAATASLDEATYLEEIYGPEAPIARQSSGSAHERPR